MGSCVLVCTAEPVFVVLLGAQESISTLSYWPARLHRLAESIPRNRFLGSINVYKYGLCIHRLRPRNSHLTPALASQDRRHLFVMGAIHQWSQMCERIHCSDKSRTLHFSKPIAFLTN